jgi:polygalacturonase
MAFKKFTRLASAMPLIALTADVTLADPTLPTIPSATFTAPVATGIAATDTANLQAAINAASTAGGGTVIVPAGTYLSNTLSLKSKINFQLSSGATIQNATPSNTLISGNTLTNVEISGSGILDGHATTTSSNNMVNLSSITNLLVTGVTIANASHEHLVITHASNATVSGVTINDNYSVAQTGDYLANTDGIDYSGSHFLFTGLTVNDGDDNIVAKPGNAFTSDVTIKNSTIGAGHGISVGGQTNLGLDGLTVSNVTFNGTDNGVRLKAGKGQGGVTKNVSFDHLTMTNVDHPIIINSWYQSGDQYGTNQVSGSSLHNTTNPGDPQITVNQSNNTAAYPFFDNISYSNITATGGAENVAIIYGLNSVPTLSSDPYRNIDNITFSNVNLSGKYGADIYYVSGLDTSGLTVTGTTAGANPYNFFGNTVATPEPGALLAVAGMAMWIRRRG